MNKNTKRVLSAITVASLSVTSFTGNIQNVVNAKENKQEENALSTNRVNAEVLENEAGAVIRVSASSNVQNVKTTYSVDTAGSKVVSFGDLKAGEVREIQVNFEEDSNKLKSLPKTTAVSDRVDFNKEVRGHKIKGSVSFEYDNGDTAPVVTPTVPTEPTKPVVTPTVPTEPTKPVVTPTVPTEPTKPVVTPTVPTEPTKPVVTPTVPTEPTKPGLVKPIKPNVQRVNLKVNVHVIQDGQPRVLTVPVYEYVDAGTKVNLEYVKEVLKLNNYEMDKLEGFPAVLDKDYTVDLNVRRIKEEPNVQRVNLEVNVHVTQDGQPRVFTVGVYKNVKAGTKVNLEYVKEVLKLYNYEAEKLEGFPAVLDKDYTVDLNVIYTKEPKKDEPAKPVTPAEPTKPAEPAKPVTPGVEKPEGKKVNLMINRHGIVNGLPSVATFWIYKDVEIGAKVDFDSVKEFLKHYGFGEDYLKKFPAVLDKDYIVDVYLNADGEPIADEPAKPVTPAEPTKPAEPAKPVTPAVTPADTGLEAGMPANVRWSRARLKEWGFTFGKITGNYDVDGDLGVFDDEDALDPAYRSGVRTIDNKIMDETMSFDDAEKNTPHGYTWNSVTKPDGTKGYAMYLFGLDRVFNDAQKAR